tara:strand:+ start:2610 stop:2825 length:216 start_codon:yes stop_codon:yes gene_type:complete
MKIRFIENNQFTNLGLLNFRNGNILKILNFFFKNKNDKVIDNDRRGLLKLIFKLMKAAATLAANRPLSTMH